MNLTINFDNVYLEGSASVSGPEEKASIISEYLDYCFDDIYVGEKTFEQGEIKMVKKALSILLDKCINEKDNIDLCLGGDLLDQCAISNHIGKFLPVSFFSVYGACSSLILGLVIGSYFVSNKTCRNVINFASSNYATAERQFRNPLNYGGQKKMTTTITSTGSTALMVGKNKTRIRIKRATLGKVEDVYWNDTNDLGSPMAYAAYSTLNEHFHNTNTTAADYDLIVTGDLSKVGSNILHDMFLSEGYKLNNHIDAGSVLYSHSTKFFSGGSGCACIGLVGFSYVTRKLIKGEIENVLLIGTGALHSPTLVNQKETIPVVAHLIELERVNS